MMKSDTENLQGILEEKKRIEIAGQFRWFYWVILFASFLATIMAWQTAKSQNDTRVKSQFERERSQTINLVTERMRKYEDILISGAAFLKVQEEYTDIHQWKGYAESLDIENKYPGINGIGVIHNIQADQMDLYEAFMQKDRSDFKIYPEHDAAESFPIAYIEPVDTNAQAVGLDIAHEENRYNAAKNARNTGKPQITGPIILVQDAQKTPGFLFYAPFFKGKSLETPEARRENFGALVYAPFIFNKLMQGTLETTRRQVNIKITDNGDVLYNENTADTPGFDEDPLFQATNTVEMYGRQWIFETQSTLSFQEANHNNRPLIILLSGLLINALLLWIFLLITRFNRRTASFADKLANAHEDKAARLADVIDNAVEGLMTMTEDGIIQTFNKACADIFETDYDAAIEQPVSNFIPNILLPTVSSSNKPTEVTGKRKSGKTFPAELSANTLIIHGKKVYSIIIRDISKRKQDENAIKKTMAELKQSNADLEKFAYIASHDLKSPLRAIDNLSLWLTEDLGPIIDPENKERLDLLRGRVIRMENLLNDLLNYSRATDIAQSTKPIKASALIEGLEESLDMPDGFDIHLSDGMHKTIISKMPLQNIFHNIISNAIKHHDKDAGRIAIDVKDIGRHFEFSVSDDGPGIPREYHEQIFDIFQTLKPRDVIEGSGMGLAIVKKLVNRNGGEIHVESEAGHGSCFIFTWPKVDFETLDTAA